jgi:hypothetical protein
MIIFLQSVLLCSSSFRLQATPPVKLSLPLSQKAEWQTPLEQAQRKLNKNRKTDPQKTVCICVGSLLNSIRTQGQFAIQPKKRSCAEGAPRPMKMRYAVSGEDPVEGRLTRSCHATCFQKDEPWCLAEPHPVVTSTQKKRDGEQTPHWRSLLDQSSLTSRRGECSMDLLYTRCCGIDAHKHFVVACLSIKEGGESRKEVRRFGTMSCDLIALREWLLSAHCTHVSMESTGVYWRTVYSHLYGFFELVVANAQHMRRVPGRKVRHEVA